MSKKQPDFQSNIPEHLILDASPQDKWMMENISILTQKATWLAEEQEMQSDKLNVLEKRTISIETQTKLTNGRVTKEEYETGELKESIESARAKLEEHDKIISPLQAFGGILVKKTTWIAVGLFFLFLYPWVLEYKPIVVKALLSLFF